MFNKLDALRLVAVTRTSITNELETNEELRNLVEQIESKIKEACERGELGCIAEIDWTVELGNKAIICLEESGFRIERGLDPETKQSSGVVRINWA